jgi:phage repressor protein C with HTH and peptisase S24 domain
MLEKQKYTVIEGRIEALKAKLGRSVKILEQESDLSNGSIDKWEDRHLENPTKNISKFLKHYAINPEWWRTGKGDIILGNSTSVKDSDAARDKLVPSYGAIAVGGTAIRADLAPVSEPEEWIYPGTIFKDADAVITVYGDSMWRDYPHMCKVVCREVKNRRLILWGQVYVIETTEYRVVKRVRRGEDKEAIRGESINTVKDAAGKEIHEHLDIPMDDIVRLFLVIGKVDRVQA